MEWNYVEDCGLPKDTGDYLITYEIPAEYAVTSTDSLYSRIFVTYCSYYKDTPEYFCGTKLNELEMFNDSYRKSIAEAMLKKICIGGSRILDRHIPVTPPEFPKANTFYHLLSIYQTVWNLGEVIDPISIKAWMPLPTAAYLNCPECNGYGGSPGVDPADWRCCDRCKGTGRIRPKN